MPVTVVVGEPVDERVILAVFVKVPEELDVLLTEDDDVSVKVRRTDFEVLGQSDDFGEVDELVVIEVEPVEEIEARELRVYVDIAVAESVAREFRETLAVAVGVLRE